MVKKDCEALLYGDEEAIGACVEVRSFIHFIMFVAEFEIRSKKTYKKVFRSILSVSICILCVIIPENERAPPTTIRKGHLYLPR